MQLMTFASTFGEPSDSPFCTKAMCLLHMSSLPWTAQVLTNPNKAPYGKLPVLIDGAKTIPDSENIRAYLEEKTQISFDAGLTPVQQAQSHALIRMVEEHMSFGLIHTRWADDANWAHLKQAYFGAIPKPIRGLVSGQIRKSALKALSGQGLGRMSGTDILARMEQDIAAIVTILGDRLFVFGDRPTAADATLAPWIGAVLTTPESTGLTRIVAQTETLRAYWLRARAAIYPNQPHPISLSSKYPGLGV